MKRLIRIAKANKLSTKDLVDLIKVNSNIESIGYCSLDNFRLLLQFMPGLTTQLRQITDDDPVMSKGMLKARYLNIKNYNKLIDLYEARVCGNTI